VAGIKESKTQGDDVEKDVAFDEGTAKESVDELIEKLKRKKPKEFAFLKADTISPEEPLDEPQGKGPAGAPSSDVPPAEQPSHSLSAEETSSMDLDLSSEVPPSEGPSSELPPLQTMASMAQDIPSEGSVPEESVDVPPAESPSEPMPAQATSSMERDLPPEETVPEEPDELPPERQPVPPPKKRSLPVLRTTLIILLFLISLGLYAYFVYPTMYENRTVKSGDTAYPVKINRLTKSMQYYHMGTWHDGPILKTSTYRAHVTIPSDARSVPAEDTTLKAAEETPVKVPETNPVPSVESPPEKKVDTAIAEAEKEAEKPEEVAIAKSTLLPGEKIVKPAGQYIYAIRISSMRLKKFAEEFLEETERKGLDAHMRVIETEKHELWYAIYIGHFADREEAVTYMKEKNITDSYPGSYIRKISNR
jgi:hypothetical protein